MADSPRQDGFLGGWWTRVLLSSRLWPSLLVLMILTAGGAGTYSVYLGSRSIHAQTLAKHMLQQAEAAAALIDGDEHALLVASGEQDSERYERLVDPIRRVKDRLPGVRFLYTYYLDDEGQVRFALDATPPGVFDEDGVEQHSYLGDVYELDDPDEPMILAIRDGRALVDLEPFTDDWGTTVSAYVPIRDQQGNAIGAVGLDIDAGDYLAEIGAMRRAALMSGVPILLLSGILGFLAGRWQQSHLLQENKHRQRLRLLEEAIEQTPNAIVITDEDGTILYVNRAFCQTTGFSVEDAVGGNPRVLKSGMHDREFYRELWSVIRSGKTWSGNLTNRKKSGEIYYERAVISPVRDAGGRISHFVAVKQDITAHRLAEEELLESQRRLSVATRGTGIGIWELELAGGRLTWDERMFELYDVDPAGFKNSMEDWRNCVPEDILPSILEQFYGCIEGKNDFTIEFPIHRRDGSMRYLAGWAVVTRDDEGRPLRVTGVNFDITDRKQSELELAGAREAAEGANRAKTQFLANMSHEIRTPMTAILGFADILRSSINEPGLVGHIETIRRNGNHLLELINDILDLSKIEAGKIEVDYRPGSVHDLVAEVSSLMSARAAEKGLFFNHEFVGDVPRTITTDPLRVRQILINLIGNAIKFTDEGGVRLLVRYPADGEAHTLGFDVIDTGTGIKPEAVSALFKPFSQVDESHSRRFGGTGLGLAISRQLAAVLSGRLSLAESEPGVGSTFRLTLPLTAEDEADLMDRSQSARRMQTMPEPAANGSTKPDAPAESHQDLAGVRILLAEDGADNQRLIRFLLEKQGAEVTLAENGQEAVARITDPDSDTTPFNLVLMDMQMPVKDGYTATRELRDLGCRIPIIALTAHAMSGDRDRCLEAGCDDYATKPLDRQKLFAVIRRWMGESRRDAA